MCTPMPATLRLLILVAAHPKLRNFVQLCAWSILSLGPKPPFAHYPAFIVYFVTNILVPQVKKLSLFVAAFKDLYVSLAIKKTIIIPQASHQAVDMCFNLGFLRFNPPLCDYSRSASTWDLQFPSASQLEESTSKWGSQFMLGEIEPSFKEFLASLARIHFQSLRSFFLLPK
jgi:hypothetical protein